jgi:spermidine synthase
LNSSLTLRKTPFLVGVFLLTFSLLTFQIVQTRILSVMAWYYMAFFAISVAMLGMTVGAVWVYLHRERIESKPLSVTLTNFTLATAVAMPLSIMVQFCLITVAALSLTTFVSWSLLLVSMAVPYVFSGIVVSLALTRSPFPTGQVYGVDLLGAALGCMGVIGVLNVLDGPTAVIVSGVVCGVAAIFFGASAVGEGRGMLRAQGWWRRALPVTVMLLVLALVNALTPIGVRPVLVKNRFETSMRGMYERWNSYSRILADAPSVGFPDLWGASPVLPADTKVEQIGLNIDGAAGTTMFHYDGTPQSISLLQYDLVSLAYRLPGIRKSAVVGVGGGRDLMTAHYFGVPDTTGVELNPIFIDLLTKVEPYKSFSNLTAIPNLKLHVDDARSWFASTPEKFDLVQMSMIDTWAATGAGAFSLSENGLYTVEGWKAFLRPLNDNGIFTVSRWYGSSDINETGRMIGLATAVLHDLGVRDVRPQLFVACNGRIATLVLSKKPFTPQQLGILHDTVTKLGFQVLLAPDVPPDSPLLRAITESPDRATLDRVVAGKFLDLSVPTDNRPFFFNQLKFVNVPVAMARYLHGQMGAGVVAGNLLASAVLLMILVISVISVIFAVIIPLRSAAKLCARPLAVRGSVYFSLIGMGFMLAEIALLERFSVYLGHPIYSLSVCLFSLILASGLGSMASDKMKLDTRGKLAVWACFVVGYLVAMAEFMPVVFEHTTDQERMVRIVISVAAILPLGFLLGFAFPTGMRLVEAIDAQPTPWFWGINGATGVLASVLGVMFSMALGINVTMLLAALCYLLIIPTGISLLEMRARA